MDIKSRKIFLALCIFLCMGLSGSKPVKTKLKSEEKPPVSQVQTKPNKEDVLRKEREKLLRDFPRVNRGGISGDRVIKAEKLHGVGPASERIFESGKRRGRFIATTYHSKFDGRITASGVEYLHKTGYRVASNRFPLGTLLCLKYKGEKNYFYCVVVVADTGKLYKDRSDAFQIDCSEAVAKSLGLYYNNNRYGEYSVLSMDSR